MRETITEGRRRTSHEESEAQAGVTVSSRRRGGEEGGETRERCLSGAVQKRRRAALHAKASCVHNIPMPVRS